MARDYAHRGKDGGRQARNTRGPSGGGAGGGLPGWIWLVAGLSVGLAVAAFIYIQRPTEKMPGTAMTQTAPAAPAATTAAPGKTGGKSQAIPLPPKEKDRFTFYEILRNQEIIVPRESVRDAKPPPAATTATSSYLIQTASFRAQPEAERHKASLALLGVESRIETVTIDNKDTFYRVRIGPITEWSRVQSTMARLEENGIQGMIVRLR